MTLEDKLLAAHHKLWIRLSAENNRDALDELYDYAVLVGELLENYHGVKGKLGVVEHELARDRRALLDRIKLAIEDY